MAGLGCAAWGEVLNARSYVQAGLSACFDGIENAGYGSHNASATTWKDLTGNGYDATRVSGSANVAWTANGWTNTADGRPFVLPLTFSTLLNPAVFSIEFTVKPSRQNSRQCFLSQYNKYGSEAAKGVSVEHNAGGVTSGILRFYYENNPNLLSTVVAEKDVVNNFTYTAKSGAHIAYKNGAQAWTASNTIGYQPDVRKPFYLGGDPTRDNMGFRGAWHSLRVYSRILTADEAKLNSAIDRVRYAAADPTTISLPTGYRITAAKDLQVLVKAQATTGGSVTVNGEAAGAGVYVSRESTMALVAVPDAGYEFVRWLGVDVGSAQVAKSAASATVGREPTTLTAIFRPQGTGVSAGEYVKHGLFVWLDGQDNAGTGVHSDTPSVWADLSGHGNDATLGTGLVWGANGWSNATDTRPATLGLAVSAALAKTGIFTVDFACRCTKQRTRSCFFSQYNGAAKGAFALEHNGSSQRLCGGLRLYQEGHATGFNDYSENAYSLAEEEVTLAAVITPASRSMFKNGLYCDTSTNNLTMIAIPSGISCVVGGEPSRDTMAFRGDYHAFRLYTRTLTEAELMINAATDTLRYKGWPLEDVRLPEGASFDANTNIWLKASADVRGVGSIQVDSEPHGRHYEVQRRLNSEISLTAVPTRKDVPFAGWEGDVDLIQSGATNTPSIVVSAARPFKLTAKFCRPDGTVPNLEIIVR